jgi:S1-C subfamily serine protease
VQIGEQVFVVGAPLGITHTLTVGHLSARHKPNATFSGMLTAEFFQTDAAINRGNSGGPMFDLKGEVIGIVSSILSQSGGSDGLGFAATSNIARRLLLDEPSVWSGLDGYLLIGEAARAFNLPVGFEAGLLVQRVALGSPADQLGVRGGKYGGFQNEELSRRRCDPRRRRDRDGAPDARNHSPPNDQRGRRAVRCTSRCARRRNARLAGTVSYEPPGYGTRWKCP